MRKNEPAYLTIYGTIRNMIIRKAYQYGQKLPSKRTLAETMHVSVITVDHAYELLIEEGYVRARERSGYFVSYRDSDPFLSGAYDIHDDNDAASDQTPDTGSQALTDIPPFPFQSYARTVRRVLSDEGENLFVKSENQGRYDLRSAISSYLMRNRGINATPEQIIVGSGAEYLYAVAVAILGRDYIYAVEEPSYYMIDKIYRQNGVRTDHLPMGKDGIRSEALLSTDAKVLHVTPFHSYPTGVTASASKRAEYVRWATKRDAIIIEDDYDSEFAIQSRREDTLFSMEPQNHIIYINTFSRTISRATRIGYMVLPAATASEFLSRISFFSCTVPVLDQVILRELLNSGEFERHINRVRRKLNKA